MLRKFLIAILAIALLVAAFFIKTLRDAGEFKTIEPHFKGTKTFISGIIGAEDITIDFENNTAIISADDRFATLHGRHERGMIYALNLNEPASKPFVLIDSIHPHGISLYQSPQGHFIYVVNHDKGKHSILLYHGKNLVRTFQDSAFILSPNDVVAVDERRFYFTNDHGSHTHIGKKLEDYFQLKKSNVIYFDGENYSIAADNIAYANGINMSRDGKEVYVASTIAGSVQVYDRDSASGKLMLKDEIFLKTGIDNIELDEEGNLWVACHPKLLTFVRHANDTSKLSPSQVFKLSKNASGKFSAKEIFLSKGDDLSASSVAAVTGNTMLIGSVMDEGILRCEIK
ncbi:MAG: SMP-30/gluconolactonase/LRE family protein [Chitinophagales bacterium]|nr:SMP-30/gluconolactonase/LRE family protein [Chitinophagales bacterium]